MFLGILRILVPFLFGFAFLPYLLEAQYLPLVFPILGRRPEIPSLAGGKVASLDYLALPLGVSGRAQGLGEQSFGTNDAHVGKNLER